MPSRPARSAGRGRIALIVAAVVLFMVFTSLRGIAAFYTDFLWFDSLGRSDVFSGVLGAKFLMVALFAAVFFVVMLVNLIVADRIAPTFRPVSADDELLRRYRQMMDRRAGLVRASVAGGTALLAGLGTSAYWSEWLLFRNAVAVGQTDPLFGLDVGFYLFRLPFLTVVADWLFTSLVIVLIVTTIAHYLNGGIRLQSPIERVTPQVKAHLSVLVGLLALVKAASYWLDRYLLLFSTRGAVDGATYTDVQAQLPAIYLLMIIALLSFGLFIVNIRRRGWVLPVVAVGLWAFVAIVAGTAYPAFIQKFQVDPAQSSKEAPYVARNIEATRDAFGLDAVETIPFAYEDGPAARGVAVTENVPTLNNAQLLDPSVVAPTYQKLQAGLSFYQIPDLDVDRYPIRQSADAEAELTQTIVATRDLNSAGIPGGSWENQHLVYTHGYGVALSAANATLTNGQPDFLVRDVPVRVDEANIDLPLDRPELYVGENMGGYSIVGTTRDEVAYLDTNGTTVPTRYEGDAGVKMDSFTRKAAFALRFGDWNPLVSDFVTDESKIIYIRDVRERVQAVAPFLSLDADPYPVVADGQIYYVLDAYTTSSAWPYSQQADTTGLPETSGLRGNFNYVRNSVKAVVNAYEGTVTLYAMDTEDPVLAVWAKAFPELFTPRDQMPDALWDHIRMPQDLFSVQTTMWGRYHIADPEEFLGQTNAWDVAPDPGEDVTQAQASTVIDVATGRPIPRTEDRVAAYYQIMKLPGDAKESFVLFRTFVPRSDDDRSQKLTAFMAAKSDPNDPNYGKLVAYTLPSELQVNGPKLVASRMLAEPAVSERISLLDTQGSKVKFGALLTLPLADTLMYVRPLYVLSASDQVPELKEVIVVSGERVIMRPTLKEAILELFGVELRTFEQQTGIDGSGDGTTDGSTPPTTTPGGGEPSENQGDLATQLQEIQDLLTNAEDDLRANGDLGAYQDAVTEAQRRLDEIQGLVPGATTTTATTAPPAAA